MRIGNERERLDSIEPKVKKSEEHLFGTKGNPPRSSHLSLLEAIDPAKARPARVKRIWGGNEYFYDCFATQTVKDEFVASDIVVGDYVIVHFDDIGEQIVTSKVFKSW